MIEIVTLIVLLILGLLLIFAEVIFVPGTTFVGLIGVLFSGSGIYLTFAEFGTTAGWIVLVANLLLIIWAILYGLKANVWKKVSLNTALTGAVNSENRQLIEEGIEGITLSNLRPYGNAEFDGKVVEVKTLGAFVEAGTKVKVIKSELNSIIVETLTD